MRSPGGGELSLSACPGAGNRPPNENKIANPRGYAQGGGMVTGRIEPCIIRRAQCLKEFHEVFGACNAEGNKIAYLWVIVAELLVEYVCRISL